MNIRLVIDDIISHNKFIIYITTLIDVMNTFIYRCAVVSHSSTYT